MVVLSGLAGRTARGRALVALSLSVLCAMPTPLAASTLLFEKACSTADRLTVVAVGDLLFHRPIQMIALKTGNTYRQFWTPLDGIIAGADLAYANLEGTVADGVAPGGDPAQDPGRRFDGRVYGARAGALYYNYHPSLIDDLAASGFDVVSTANNHAMDRFSLGADRTVDNLDSRKFPFTGTRKVGETTRPWSTVTKAKGFAVAWLACTFDTNGNPDRKGQVLRCHEQRETVLAEVRRLVADPAIDAVVVTPHWGEEGDRDPVRRDRELAAQLISAGASAVIGTHPHVVQGWAKMQGTGGHEGLVVYSTGNFISNQRRAEQRTGLAVVMELTKGAGAGGKAKVTAAGWLPTWVEFNGDTARRVSANDGTGKASAGLKRARALLPEGNELTLEAWRMLPRQCAEAASTTSDTVSAAGP
jgi:Bacterial capsule synthesis protein PGA_cap